MRTDASDTRAVDAAGADATGAASRSVGFRFSLDDGQRDRAVRVLVRVTYLGPAGVTLGIVLVAAVFFALRTILVRGPDLFSIAVVAGSFLLLAAPIRAVRRARRQVRSAGLPACTVAGDLGPKGIVVRAGEGDAETLDWARVRSAAPLREGLLIRLREPQQAILLPVTAFGSAEVLQRAVAIARAGMVSARRAWVARSCAWCGYPLPSAQGTVPGPCPECGLDGSISTDLLRPRPATPWEALSAGVFIGVMFTAGVVLFRVWLGWGVEPPESWGYPLLIATGLTAGSIGCGALSGRFLQGMPRLAAHAFAAPLVLVCIAGGIPVSLREGEPVSAAYFAVLAAALLAAAAIGLRIGRRRRLAAGIAALSRPVRRCAPGSRSVGCRR